MMPSAKTLVGYLPLLIFAGVMLWRLRTVDKARPLRLRTMWILPLLFAVVVGFVFAKTPPAGIGIACFAVGLAIGAAVGWKRAQMMRLHVEGGEGATSRVMIRQSPAALLLVMAIAAIRMLSRTALDSGEAVGSSQHLPVAAVTLTDALLGFALGMIVAHRIELWRRARKLVDQPIKT